VNASMSAAEEAQTNPLFLLIAVNVGRVALTFVRHREHQALAIVSGEGPAHGPDHIARNCPGRSHAFGLYWPRYDWRGLFHS